MTIIRRLNCIDEASGIVLSVSGLPVHRLREYISNRYAYSLRKRKLSENLFDIYSLNLCTGRPLTERKIPDAASIQFSLVMMVM